MWTYNQVLWEQGGADICGLHGTAVAGLEVVARKQAREV